MSPRGSGSWSGTIRAMIGLGKRVMECDELRQEVARLKRKCNRLVRKVGALSARVSESGNDDE
jgi:hypothetical protein